MELPADPRHCGGSLWGRPGDLRCGIAIVAAQPAGRPVFAGYFCRGLDRRGTGGHSGLRGRRNFHVGRCIRWRRGSVFAGRPAGAFIPRHHCLRADHSGGYRRLTAIQRADLVHDHQIRQFRAGSGHHVLAAGQPQRRTLAFGLAGRADGAGGSAGVPLVQTRAGRLHLRQRLGSVSRHSGTARADHPDRHSSTGHRDHGLDCRLHRFCRAGDSARGAHAGRRTSRTAGAPERPERRAVSDRRRHPFAHSDQGAGTADRGDNCTDRRTGLRTDSSPGQQHAMNAFPHLSGAPVLGCKGLSYSVRGTALLKDVDLNITAGETLAVVGPNGSGKSTLLKLLAGIQKPVTGRVTLGDQPLSAMSRRDVARMLAVVEQQAETSDAVTVLDAVELGRTPWLSALEPWSAEDDAIVHQALQDVDMLHMQKRAWHTLSGGERQRVHIARALAQRPRILLLDEPTNHLDIQHQLTILGLVKALPVTTVIALHDLNQALDCDRVAVMEKGRLVALGAPEKVLTPERLLSTFGVLAHWLTDPFDGTKILRLRSI
ncbi:Iron ABC transporter ATP-binding protein [Pseudomonas coronafaciens pv. garcae]|nr:Iron ABC transporter ATP-binding protein [Pseudomonas coronafaciens pv. garcae]